MSPRLVIFGGGDSGLHGDEKINGYIHFLTVRREEGILGLYLRLLERTSLK